MVVMIENGLLSRALNARIMGSGAEAMVLAHGFGTNQSLWDKILPKLCQHYRVVVFDWSFSGAIKDPNLFDPQKYCSYYGFAQDLIALLEELGLSSTIFIGHSMSGLIGCIAYTQSPHLFQRLILLCASPRYINTEDYEGGFDNSDIEQIIANIESNYENWATNFSSLVVDESDPVSLGRFQKCLHEMRPEVAVSLAKTVFCSDERDVLEKVDIPCTIVQTKTDIVVPASVATYMQKKIKGSSTVEVIDTQGHFPHLTAHLQLLQVLGAVLGF
ncbi:probable strigolactone esterase DAD2 [Momordica charantia]|uniref:Probable strigolactone esterase DAD2 n=1 Tax=Momordica charantia TaxID=3673 RepID=A0A6J1CV13_MOMCH|nr:probable strigolactone esterase DAD2 [Momordica charantia]